jgi:bacteriorhodopsin
MTKLHIACATTTKKQTQNIKEVYKYTYYFVSSNSFVLISKAVEELHIACTTATKQTQNIKEVYKYTYYFVSSNSFVLISKAVEESGRTSSAGSICLVSSW